MIDHAVQFVVLDHLDHDAVLVEHVIHRFADADQCAFRQAFDGATHIVLKPDVGSARSEMQIRGVDERAAPFREHLVEAAEDGIARHADECQAIFFIGLCADPARGFVFHFFHKVLEKLAALFCAAKIIRDPQIHRSIRQRIEQRRFTLVEFEHALPADVHVVGVRHCFAQAVNVEFLSRYFFAQRDQFPDLRFDVFAIARKIRTARLELSARLARGWHVQDEDWHAVHPFPNFRPFNVGIAGVGQHGQRGLGDFSHRVGSFAQVNADVGFDVSANIG